MDAANVDAGNFGDGGKAAKFRDDVLGRVHAEDNAVFAMRSQVKSCEVRNGAIMRFPHNHPMDITWILEGLKKPGKTQRGLADYMELDPSAVSRILSGDRQIKAAEAAKIEEYLGSDFVPAKAPSPARAQEMAQDVPVRGAGGCGEDGIFEFNGQVLDFVRRPPRLAGARDAYALYVAGESMSPWREEGALVYVHPHQPVRIDDYVVVQLKPIIDGQAPAAYIKRLVRRTAADLRLLQYNPRKELTIPTKKILAIHRIIDWSELMGI